jgi:alkyl hydroperoxide reductase subunit F
VVVGGGPAGFSAAIYLVRKKLKTLLISPEFGGQAAKSAEVENYLGFTKISGPELMQKFFDHAEALGVETQTVEITKIEKKDNDFEINFENGSIVARSVLITSGKTPRKLGVPGEDEFAGKGVGYCAVCDGPLFRDKTVAVIGGGNSALDSALELEKYCSKVYMLNLNSDFQGDEIRKDRVEESKKIETLSEVQTTEIFGDNFMKGLKYKTKGGEIKDLACDGAFIEIGWMPATEFVKDLVELNNLKEIKINRENKTACEGIFAAGDVTDILEKQIIIAAGEGAKAALNVWKYLVLKKN